MVRFNVATESHPAALVVSNVYTPLCVYAVPFQVYVLHVATSSLDEELMLIVRFSVTVESHPAAVVYVCV